MFALLPLAMVIALILNSPSLWEAFNDPEVDLFPVLLRLLVTALLVDVVLYVANRTLAKYLAHPPIDIPQVTEIVSGQTITEPAPAPPTINVATVAEISPPLLTGEESDSTPALPSSTTGVPDAAPGNPGPNTGLAGMPPAQPDPTTGQVPAS
jgi:hypothetical protein